MKLNLFFPIILLAFISLTSATCGSEKKATETVAAPKPLENTPEPNPFNAAHVFNEERADTVQGTRQVKAPPRQQFIDVHQIPPTNTSRKAYLGSGLWYPVMAYQSSDTTVHHNYLGKFLNFKPDFTFDILEKNKIVNSGKWNFDDDKMLIYLSCPNPYFNNTWKIMEKGFTMIWIGQTQENVSGMQIRWNCQK